MDSKWPDKYKYRWQRTVTLTKPEGEVMEQIITQHDCANVSQLCKKIVHEELLLIPNEKEADE